MLPCCLSVLMIADCNQTRMTIRFYKDSGTFDCYFHAELAKYPEEFYALCHCQINEESIQSQALTCVKR